MSPLDTPIKMTIFPDHYGRMQRKREMSLREFKEIFADTYRADKAKLPVVKMQIYGKQRTADGCLRNNDNVQAITGIEIDHDGAISIRDAEKIFAQANVAAFIYPTW